MVILVKMYDETKLLVGMCTCVLMRNVNIINTCSVNTLRSRSMFVTCCIMTCAKVFIY